MDTLGGRESAAAAPANGHEPRTFVRQSAATPADVTEESHLDLPRPKVLIRFMKHDQTIELIAAAERVSTHA